MSVMLSSIPADPIMIRRWEESHLDSLLSAMEQSIEELRRWMAWAAEGVPTRKSQLTAMRLAIADFDHGVDWQYSLFEPADDALVGGCGLHRTASDDCAEISYWVRSDRQGRGYATAAARSLTSAAFEALPQLKMIQARMDCANLASARVTVKLGYTLVGTESHQVPAAGHTGRRYVWATAR